MGQAGPGRRVASETADHDARHTGSGVGRLNSLDTPIGADRTLLATERSGAVLSLWSDPRRYRCAFTIKKGAAINTKEDFNANI